MTLYEFIKINKDGQNVDITLENEKGETLSWYTKRQSILHCKYADYKIKYGGTYVSSIYIILEDKEK